MKICSKCIMDTSVSNILFDEHGICNFCKLHDQFSNYYPISNKNLLLLKNKIKSKKNFRSNYDCICGVSGGRDSIYNLYYVKKKLNLNPLAVNFDNGWHTKISNENIKNACNNLGVDLVTVVQDWETFKKIQTAFLFSSVPDVDVPYDIGIFKSMYIMAAKENVKYVLNGHTFRNEGFDPLHWTYMDGKYAEDIYYSFYKSKLTNFYNFKLSDFIYYKIFLRIKTELVLNYINYNHGEVENTLLNECGWKSPGGHHFESAFTKFCVSYYLPKKFGIDRRKVDLSARIREKKISRNDALNIIKEPPFINKELIDYVLYKLDISKKDFNKLLIKPNRKFTEFKSYYNLIKKFDKIIKLGVNLNLIPKILYYKFKA